MNIRPGRLGLLSVSFLAAALAGCSRDDGPPPEPGARPVKTIVVASPEQGGIRRFPGRIDALNKAEMAFRVPGTIAELPVKEGDQVAAGDLLAALDPTDYQIAVDDAQATFDRAKNDFARAEELVKDGFISRSEFDAKEADLKNADAALSRAKQDLAYTRLAAPFDGVVAQRYVERAEEVQAKEAVMAIQDNALLEVRIDVPETVILGITPSETRQPEPGRFPTTVTFDSRPGQEFDLTLREVATRADSKTQTFEVSFTMPTPEDFNVFPGMTATVIADMRSAAGTLGDILIPSAAVTADARLEPFVWVVDDETMRVSKTAIEPGRLTGGRMVVKGGLEPGERVVVAGVGQLAEGMEVRLLAEREEAEPRAEDRAVLEAVAEAVPASAAQGGGDGDTDTDTDSDSDSDSDSDTDSDTGDDPR